jgi:cyclopropane-fatty-acyl-phospholipid synthase
MGLLVAGTNRTIYIFRMSVAIEMAERGLLPEPVVRYGIRRLLRRRIAGERQRHTDRERALARFAEDMAASPVAPLPALANRQHYEVPAAFFEVVLGKHLKYSSALWPEGVGTLDEAEEAMLALTCERAGLADGQRILELGCGWGSLTLFAAARFRQARILAVSNSAAQRDFIEARAAERGLGNVRVVKIGRAHV